MTKTYWTSKRRGDKSQRNFFFFFYKESETLNCQEAGTIDVCILAAQL